MKDKVILVVSFGTTYHETCEKTIGACEEQMARSFPEYQVRRAFTSNIVRKILQERDGLSVDNTAEALEKIADDGFQEVVIQPLHIIPGEEYHEKVLAPAAEYQDKFARFAVGRPLLYDFESYRAALEALRRQLPPRDGDHAVVLMGHGSAHFANACYAMLQLLLFEELPGVYLANIEGYPGLEKIIPKLKAAGIREVTLQPYMLVAGDHAQNDMAGEKEDSWKNILQEAGFKVNVHLAGLGENPAYREIFVQRVRDCMQRMLNE